MLKQNSDTPKERVPLSRERVLRGAIAVADSAGVRALTIRSLAAELGVTPMSVYYYVANKSEILDGIVDEVFAEIDLPPGDRSTGQVRPSSAEPPPLGDRPLGVPQDTRPHDVDTPRRHDRHTAERGLLGRDDRPRLRPARQLCVRVRDPGGRSALPRPGDRRRSRRAHDGAVPPQVSTPT